MELGLDLLNNVWVFFSGVDGENGGLHGDVFLRDALVARLYGWIEDINELRRGLA